VKGVLSHPELPERPIDLVHGTDSHGIRHVDKDHSGALDRLPEYWDKLKVQSDSQNRTLLKNSDAKAVVRKDWDGERKDWLTTFYRFEDPPSGKRTGGATVSGPASLDRRTLPNVGPYEPINKPAQWAPYQIVPYSAAHVVGQAVQQLVNPTSPPASQQQGEATTCRFDDLPRTIGGAAVSGPASLDRQTNANVSPFESAHKAVPFVPYQSVPYSAARLSGQTFEDQVPVLRLVPPQQQGAPDSSAVMRSLVDQAAASGATPAPSEDTNELLKLRAIVQAVGSRGLLPIQ
jgi:hypothetical protein